MGPKRAFKKRYFVLFIGLILLNYFTPSMFGGYSWSEQSVINRSVPYDKGEIVFEKDFENRKAVVSNVDGQKYVKVIETKFGFLHRLVNIGDLSGTSMDGKMKTTWSATQRGDVAYYDTVFAAEVLDEEIVKVVVSNDRRSEEYKEKTLEEVKEQSNLFVELEVVNGYAASYNYLPSSQVGDLVFRGINSEGEIISTF